MTNEQQTIAAAFFHPTRRVFVPMTTADVSQRTGMNRQGLGTQLHNMIREGYVVSSRTPCENLAIFELADVGKRIVMGARV